MTYKVSFFAVLLFLPSLIFSQEIHIKKENNGYWILEDENKVFFFQRELNNTIPEYSKNNYLHPVYDLSGNCITEDFPQDHPHQRGIFWAWHQILIHDKQICDGWLLDNFTQKVRNLEFVSTEKGLGILKYSSYWFTKENQSDPILREKVKITTHLRTDRYRQIDFEIVLQALEENLSIGGSNDQKGYGGFSIRMKTDEETKFINKNDDEIEPTLFAIESEDFINIKNRKNGVVIISNNDEDSTPWILRQKDSMQNAVWPGKEPIKLTIEEPITLKYSILIHNGRLKNKSILQIIKN